MHIYEKSGQLIDTGAAGLRGKRFQTPNVSCVRGAVSRNPRVVSNCVLTVNKE